MTHPLASIDYITQSELQTFCDCPTKHKFAYDELLKTKRLNVAFFIGTAFHSWLEAYYLGKPQALNAIKRDMQAKAKQTSSPSDEEKIEQTIACLNAVAKIYPQFDPVKRFKLQVLKVEHRFFAPLNLSLPRVLTGKMDLLAKDSEGKIWIMDNKIVSEIDQRLVESFRLNRQAQTYLLGARQDREIQSMGTRIGGFIPNLIRKPRLKRKETEGEDNFLTRVANDILTQPENYFHSEQLSFDDDASADFEKQTQDLAAHMRDPKRLIYQNYGQCQTIYGPCPFHGKCARIPGHESLLTTKTTRHEELTDVKITTSQVPAKASANRIVLASIVLPKGKRPSKSQVTPASGKLVRGK